MSLMTNSSTGDISTMVAELLYALCKENVGRLVSQRVLFVQLLIITIKVCAVLWRSSKTLTSSTPPPIFPKPSSE